MTSDSYYWHILAEFRLYLNNLISSPKLTFNIKRQLGFYTITQKHILSSSLWLLMLARLFLNYVVPLNGILQGRSFEKLIIVSKGEWRYLNCIEIINRLALGHYWKLRNTWHSFYPSMRSLSNVHLRPCT